MKIRLLNIFLPLALPAYLLACYGRGTPNSGPEGLVAKAEVIVLARAVESEKKQGFPNGVVHFNIVEVLSGELKENEISIDGHFEKYHGRSDPSKVPYLSPRPGASRGTCYAYDYKKNGLFILFLFDGSPYWDGGPTNEEVSDLNDPWYKWVKIEIDQFQPDA